MDPLSDVLSLLRPRSFMVRGLDAGGRWSLTFPRVDGVKCYAILSGVCWLAVEGVDEALRLTAGDCVLLPDGRAFRLASDMDLPSDDAKAVIAAAPEGGIAYMGGGGDCFGIGGFFDFTGSHAEILLSMLPSVIHIRHEADKMALRWCLERLMQELREPQPGGTLIGEHLVHMLLVQALRLHMADGGQGRVGWLFALADKQMRAAISAMHDDPAYPWSLQALAGRAGMSRSAFALKFKQTVGASPMDYLTRWRMLLAGDRLTHSGDPISILAPSLGYESESAFSTAFKRVMGCSPRRYGRGRTTPAFADGSAVPMAGA